MKTDAEYLKAVHEDHVTADGFGDNWVDHLPSDITGEDRYSAEQYYVSTPPDGRKLWLSP